MNKKLIFLLSLNFNSNSTIKRKVLNNFFSGIQNRFSGMLNIFKKNQTEQSTILKEQFIILKSEEEPQETLTNIKKEELIINLNKQIRESNKFTHIGDDYMLILKAYPCNNNTKKETIAVKFDTLVNFIYNNTENDKIINHDKIVNHDDYNTLTFKDKKKSFHFEIPYNEIINTFNTFHYKINDDKNYK